MTESIDAPHDIAVVALGPERWRDYRAIRLEALRREPAAFTSKLADAEVMPEAEWRRRLGNPAALRFAERDGRLVGLAGVYRADPAEPEVATVFSVYVAAEQRGRGVGRRLMEAVLEEARRRGATRARLSVAPSEAAALALYRAMGFAVVGEEPDGKAIMERPIG